MGMDIYGRKPTSEKGKYFRAGIVTWGPLCSYILDVAPKEITARCTKWNYNDGIGLGATAARRLGDFLLEEISAGHTAKYRQQRDVWIESLPRKTCECCNGTGFRFPRERDIADRDYFDQALLLRLQKSGISTLADAEAAVKASRRLKGIGWCNACHGVGTLQPEELYGVFREDAVQAFAEFARDSGGFSIW